MTIKVPMPVPGNLVPPLGHEPTATRSAETTASRRARPAAVPALIGPGLRFGDVNSAPMTAAPGTRTSTTATRTTTTPTTKAGCVSSADSAAFAFCDLVQAYIDCRRHKRGSTSCQQFEQHLERNLCDLYAELRAQQWQPGRSICFAITRPKPREVWAAQFRDRIVHHLLYNAIAPRFIAGFVAGSSACIPGRGTLYAAERLESHIRAITRNWQRPASYLKADLANYFVSIHKPGLRAQILRKVHEPYWQWLATTILMHDPRQDVEVRGNAKLLRLVPPHKSLFNAGPDTGLPIGNLSSQFFANVHLDALDQHCKHQLKARYYLRYVDDFLILHDSAQHLASIHQHLLQWLPEHLGVQINTSKTIIQPISRGVDFVGQVIQPWRRTTRPRTLHTAISRIRSMPAGDVYAAGNSYLGLMRQATHSHNARRAVAHELLQRGHAINGDWTKIYRSHRNGH